jgi:hypothetical protein
MSRLPALTSFGPEILQALIEGSRREVVVELSYADAVVMRKRMHTLRARMREDKHPLLNIVTAAKVTIRWGEEVATSKSRKNVHYPTDNNAIVELVIRPQDSTFRSALERAGIKVDAPETVTALEDDLTHTVDDILEEFLKEKP